MQLYLVALLVVLYVVLAAGTGMLALNDGRSAAARGGVLTRTPETLALRATLTPFSARSAGTVTFRFRNGRVWSGPTTSPRSYLLWLVLRHWPLALLALASQPCCGLAFAALPISRRRAKVRARHVARVVVYAATLYLPVAVMAVVAEAWSYTWVTPTGRLMSVLAAGTFVALLPATFLWWLMAIWRYLRMEHPWLVAISVTIIGWLAPVSLMGGLWVVL
ncbi:MAG: hypothetical protein ACYTGC_07230 [Planctomycetota bacterium]